MILTMLEVDNMAIDRHCFYLINLKHNGGAFES